MRSVLISCVVLTAFLLVITFVTYEEHARLSRTVTCPRQTGPRQTCPRQTCPPCPVDTDSSFQRSVFRDKAVIADPLYPPWNRTNARNHAAYADAVTKRVFNTPPDVRNNDDSYRLIAHILNQNDQENGRKDAGGNVWKVFGRQKQRNVGDFYVMPADKTSDLKISITNKMIKRGQLRDVDDLPDTITFDSPFFLKEPYTLIPLEKADLAVLPYL